MQKKVLVEKVRREDRKPLYGEGERRKERKGSQNQRQAYLDETSVGQVWKMALSPFAIGQNWLRVNAAAEGLQKRTDMMERWQHQEVQVKESRWAEEIPQRWKQPKGEDRTEMKKEAKLLRCTLLNGSAWTTERKYMRRYKGKFDFFFFWESAQAEEGGNGGAVQQRG